MDTLETPERHTQATNHPFDCSQPILIWFIHAALINKAAKGTTSEIMPAAASQPAPCWGCKQRQKLYKWSQNT